MKKIFLFLTLVAFLTGCSLDINKDPNYPSDVSATLLLPAVQNSIAATVGDGMYNYAGFFAQYYDQMPEANQYNEFVDYSFLESTQVIDRSYRTLYAGALEDVDVILKDKTASEADKFVATALRAFSFQLLVDNMDKAPYTEALKGSEIPMPKWDDGKTVYEGVLTELDDAEAKLGSDQITCSDLVLNKDLKQWIGFANALRLRMYLRMHDGGIDMTSKIKALIDKNAFFTGDIKYDVFSDEDSKRNPWYAANKVSLAMNHVASYPIISYLKYTKDPRIAYNFVKATNTNEYVGELPGAKAVLTKKKNADYSFLNYYATKPVYFFTQSELQFLLSESYIRFYNNDTQAQAAYEAGISADFSARDLTDPSVMYGAAGTVKWSSATTNAAKLELIYMQKWVALCYMDHMEAWSEIRRTDVPKLSSKTADQINTDPTVYSAGDLIIPMRNVLGTSLVKRMYFPSTARQLNDNTPASVPASTPVWWDIK